MKNGKITGKLRWQPDKFRAETTHQLYLLCLRGWRLSLPVMPRQQEGKGLTNSKEIDYYSLVFKDYPSKSKTH